MSYTHISPMASYLYFYKILQPNDNGRLQSRAWSDVTDAVFYPKMGHTTLPGEIAERVSVFWL